MTVALSDTNPWNKINEQFGTKGGIYKIKAFNNNIPVTINRLLDFDKDGILYIGMALSYLDRVITLRKSTDPLYISTNHEFGLRYKQHSTIKIKFPYESLFIELLPCDNPNEVESAELIKYYEAFGELPPLNRQQ